MNRIAKYIDVVYLIIIGVLLAIGVYRHFNDNLTLSINIYAGFFGWILVIILKVFWPGRYQFALFILLSLALFNIVSFTAETISIGNYNNTWYEDVYFSPISINPVIILLFIIYWIINRKNISIVYNEVFNPVNKLKADYDAKVKFYYDKFLAYDYEKFIGVHHNVNQYPKEAQDAIMILAGEKLDKK